MIRLTTALLTLGVGIPFATTAIAKGKASAGGLVATPRRPFVEFNADLTMFGANGKLLMPVPTPGSDCTVDTQSTIRAVPADERDSWRETAPGEMKCDAASAKQLRTPIAGCGVGSAGWERIRADVARIVFSDAKTTKTTDAGTKK